jgi:peptidyl-prolyl cis-trans isomerase A (cyclophilin A)
MTKRSRQRQLQKLAERRAEERRRRRRKQVAAMVVGGLIAAGGLTVGALALFGGDDPPAEPVAGPTPTPTQEETMAEPPGVACGGEVPAAADERKPSYDDPPDMQLSEGADYRAVLRTSCGRIEVDLFEDRTPITVNNLVFLAREGFYEGTLFHRVIAGFMNQGGDPEGTGMGGPGYQFEDEIVDELTFDRPGLFAMANAGPGTNGSQFFITAAPAEHLDGLHTIFGEVVEGMEVAERINQLETGPNDKPIETVYIESIQIREA